MMANPYNCDSLATMRERKVSDPTPYKMDRFIPYRNSLVKELDKLTMKETIEIDSDVEDKMSEERSRCYSNVLKFKFNLNSKRRNSLLNFGEHEIEKLNEINIHKKNKI